MKKLLVVGCWLLAGTVVAADVNVRDFGARGDGVTKDTLALQRAFGLHFDFHANADRKNGQWKPIYDKLTEEDVRAICDAVRPDFLQVDCKGHAGWASYPSAIGNAAPSLAGDGMALWRKVTKERGIGLYVHYSGVADQKYFTEHPDEAVKGINGWPVPGERATRPNGRYVDDVLLPQLKELADRYGIDGAWVDGECWAARADFDPRTVAQFERETGIDLKGRLPDKEDAPHRREYMDFMRRLFHRYLKHYVDEIHKAHPAFRITSNWAFTDVMPVKPCADVDFVSGDLAPGNCFYAAMISARAAASQGLTWDLMAWSFRCPGPQVPKTAAQLQQEAAAVISLGGGFQIYVTQRPDGSPRLDCVRSLRPVAEFVRARQPYCFGGKAEKQVAVLMSTEDFLACSPQVYQCGASRHSALSLGGLLCDCGHSVSLLMDHHVKAGALDGYPVVAVPEVAKALDPEVVTRLAAYVKGGGTLLVDGAKACRTLAAAGLPCAVAGEPSEKPVMFRLGDDLPGSVNAAAALAAAEAAEPLAWLYDDGTDCRKGVVAAVAPFGKGKVAAVSGKLSNSYITGAQHEHRRLANLLLARLYRPVVEVEKSVGLLHVVLLEKDGRRKIQLVNANGRHRDEASKTEDFIPPVVDVALRLNLPAKPASLVLQPSGRTLPFDWRDGAAHVTLPRVDIHEIVEVF